MGIFSEYRDKIIDYWFDKHYLEWMIHGKKYDNEIKLLFSDVLEHAMNNKLEYWKNTKKGYLAYIILLDQVPRHIYRGTKQAYMYDNKVCLFMKKNLEKYLYKYNVYQQMFILMPLQHSTNIHDQQLGIDLLTELIETNDDQTEIQFLKSVLSHQKGHYDVIKRFKRFPKRNIFYKNIKNTLDEEAYLYNERNKINKPY